MDVDFIGQLIDSMETAVIQLEQAITANRIDEANKLRTFIFDIHLQINNAIEGKENV